jgi:hypothetical protein
LRKIDADGGIGYRDAETVSQEIRRAHLVHRLLIDDPAAGIKALCFDQKRYRNRLCCRNPKTTKVYANANQILHTDFLFLEMHNLRIKTTKAK